MENSVPECHLFLRVVHPPGNMMHGSGSPLTAALLRQLFDFDQLARTAALDAITVPAILRSKQGKAHQFCEHGIGWCQLPFPQPHSMHSPQLVLSWNGT